VRLAAVAEVGDAEWAVRIRSGRPGGRHGATAWWPVGCFASGGPALARSGGAAPTVGPPGGGNGPGTVPGCAPWCSG
jgi:hypothetical protein